MATSNKTKQKKKKEITINPWMQNIFKSVPSNIVSLQSVSKKHSSKQVVWLAIVEAFQKQY